MEDILGHPVRIMAALFVSGLWGFVLVAFALGLVKLVIQKSWAAARWLSRLLRLRRRVSAAPIWSPVNPGFRMPDDITLARWLEEAFRDDEADEMVVAAANQVNPAFEAFEMADIVPAQFCEV